jgi:glycosyltransferase involved in cell wall biosynthesis
MNQLVIIGSVWPEPKSTAAGSRILQLISLFQEQGYEITFMCSAARSDYSFDLSQISVHTQSIQLNDASFDSEIAKINPLIVVFDRFMIEEQYGWRVAEQCPNTLRILDTEDLHFLRKAREMAYKQNRSLVFEDYISEQTVLLLKKYWSAIKKQLPEAQLLVYGAYVTEKVKQLHNEKEGFLIQGRASDVATVFQKAKVLLAPIPYGAGLKGKLFEAMQQGLPSVTTIMGAEGMHGNLDWNGAVAAHESEFVDDAVQLYTEENLWQTAQKNGYNILEQRFKKTLFATDFKSKIAYIGQNLSTHRQTNFWGQIIQHHSLQSTKYMSKWIEAKNK